MIEYSIPAQASSMRVARHKARAERSEVEGSEDQRIGVDSCDGRSAGLSGGEWCESGVTHPHLWSNRKSYSVVRENFDFTDVGGGRRKEFSQYSSKLRGCKARGYMGAWVEELKSSLAPDTCITCAPVPPAR